MTLAATGRQVLGQAAASSLRCTPGPAQSFELCVERESGLAGLTDRDLRQPSIFRRIARAFLRKWGVAICQDSVCLLVSELVTNALLHGRGPVSFRMVHRGRIVELSVATDESVPDLAARPGAELDECGRGLVLVDAVATDWGVRDGRVWCTLPCHSTRSA
ncbi:ATP-binding protein [Streptomyces sp. NPDC048430]|uniref:ATP-binding protein n=1 Tax=Streptomyces sp. NPDC048430 TaxID=3155388 RepID=UPI00342AF6E6